MTRRHLPNRRSADLVSFNHEGRRWSAAFGYFDDGRLAEIFLDAAKESPLAEAARESVLLVSLALQHNCPVQTIRHALSERDISPIGAALALADSAAPGSVVASQA